MTDMTETGSFADYLANEFDEETIAKIVSGTISHTWAALKAAEAAMATQIAIQFPTPSAMIAAYYTALETEAALRDRLERALDHYRRSANSKPSWSPCY